jgi:hypothetical protein
VELVFRGTLIGVRQDNLDAIEMDAEQFFSSVTIVNKQDKFCWEVVNVYGPVKYDRKAAFLPEIYPKIQQRGNPLVIGGDFNLISYPWGKNIGSNYTIWMDMFNNFINNTNLIELVRGGSRFTWTNKQKDLIRSNINRIFISMT